MRLTRHHAYFLMFALPLLFVLALLLDPVAAFAEETTRVDLTPIVTGAAGYLSVLVDTLIAAALGWALRLLNLAGNERAEAATAIVRDFLHSTIDRGIERAVSSLPAALSDIDVRSVLVAEAIEYVESQAPDALKKLGAGPEDLGRLVEAKIAERFTPGLMGPLRTALAA